MPREPKGDWVTCPDCGAEAVAVLPPHGVLVEDEERADGKVWVNCRACGERFLAYFRTDADD